MLLFLWGYLQTNIPLVSVRIHHRSHLYGLARINPSSLQYKGSQLAVFCDHALPTPPCDTAYGISCKTFMNYPSPVCPRYEIFHIAHNS
jgi:hypothetical protein